MLRINDVYVNLEEIGISFTPNEQQYDALKRIHEFAFQPFDTMDDESPDNVMTLAGYAGTGKSSVTKILLAALKQSGYLQSKIEFTAPTHRAKNVIEDLSGREAKTIHKILNLRPDVMVEKLDLRNLKFNLFGQSELPMRGLLIIDECSMINNILYNIIVEQAFDNKTKILFIGDKGQIKPVKQTNISKCFFVENIIELTKVERQSTDSPLLPILDKAREDQGNPQDGFDKITSINSEGKGVEFIQSSSAFVGEVMYQMSSDEFKASKQFSRVLTFTNDQIESYNKIIRERLEYKDEYVKGDLLTAYSNYFVQDLFDIRNSCDYLVLDCGEDEKWVDQMKLTGWSLTLTSLMDKKKNYHNIFIVSKSLDLTTKDELAELIEDLRSAAIAAGKKKDPKAKMYWAQYYSAFNQFATPEDLVFNDGVVKSKTLDYGYAITSHKSQGGTFENVLIDFNDINICVDVELRNQLKYVALSRPTHKATIFH